MQYAAVAIASVCHSVVVLSLVSRHAWLHLIVPYVDTFDQHYSLFWQSTHRMTIFLCTLCVETSAFQGQSVLPS